MISIDCNAGVSGFSQKQLGSWTLVRAYRSKFQFNVTNDGRKRLLGLSVRPVMESYLGQEKPFLFQWLDTQVIEAIPPKETVKIECELTPLHSGLVSVALYMTDSTNKAVMAKRKTSSSYDEAPVRWYFHVADDVSVEILKELKRLTARREKMKK